MVTVADLAEKYLRGKVTNKQFCSQLGSLYRKQINKREIDRVLKSLEAEVRRVEKKR